MIGLFRMLTDPSNEKHHRNSTVEGYCQGEKRDFFLFIRNAYVSCLFNQSKKCV